MAVRTGFENDSSLAISKGMIKGHARFDSLGERSSIGVTVQGEDMWFGTATEIPSPPSAGEQMSFVSDDVNDTSAGSGVQQINFKYIRASDGSEQIGIGIMNGTTEVDTTETDIAFINDLWSSDSDITDGVRVVAAGNIIMYRKGDNTRIYNMIKIGGNKSLVSNRMVPAGKTLFIQNWTVSETKSKETSFRLRANCDPDGMMVTPGFLFKRNALIKDASKSEIIDPPIRVCELAIAKVSAWVLIAGGQGSADFSGVLVDNNVIGSES